MHKKGREPIRNFRVITARTVIEKAAKISVEVERGFVIYNLKIWCYQPCCMVASPSLRESNVNVPRCGTRVKNGESIEKGVQSVRSIKEQRKRGMKEE